MPDRSPAPPPPPSPSPAPPASAAADVRVDWRIAGACAAGLAILFTIQNGLVQTVPRAPVPFGRVFVHQVVTWTTWLLLTPLIFRAGRRLRGRGRLTARALVGQLATSAWVAVLHSAIVGVARWALGTTASVELDVVVVNMVVTSFAGNVVRFWLIAAAYHAIAYHREVREREVSAARLETSLAEARLASLEGRLHPHFLFNTLNAITALIRDDPRAAEAMLTDLSELLRAALQAEPGREVTLERELDLLARYVAIQQARFLDRLRVTVHADADARPAYVPHLVLQPLVENAIRHGIAPREAAGAVDVRASRHGSMLRLVVQDDGVGFGRAPAAGAGAGIGISGTRARLAHLYGDRFVLDIRDAAPTGTVVTIEIPFRTDAEREVVVPADAEIHHSVRHPRAGGGPGERLDSRLRGNDEPGEADDRPSRVASGSVP